MLRPVPAYKNSMQHPDSCLSFSCAGHRILTYLHM